MSSIEERVKNIIVTQLGVKADEVKNESKFIDDLLSLIHISEPTRPY